MPITHVLILLLVVLLVFGTSKLKTIGSDLGAAVRGFKKAVEEGDGTESKKLKGFDRQDTAPQSKSEKQGDDPPS